MICLLFCSEPKIHHISKPKAVSPYPKGCVVLCMCLVLWVCVVYGEWGAPGALQWQLGTGAGSSDKYTKGTENWKS